VIVEVRRVEDDQQRVGLPLTLLQAKQDDTGLRFVRADRIEAVRAWEVDDFDRSAIGEDETSGFPLDRDAGVVADLLASTGQRVEQRTLAGIGVAGDRDERERVHLGQRDDADGSGMAAANGDGHAADPKRDRVATKWPEVQRFDGHALVEAEMAKPASFTLIERFPVDRQDARSRADCKLVQWDRSRIEGRVHCCE